MNFPEMPEGYQNLPSSPKDLNISRADLWAFTGILALAQFEQNTKIKCNLFEHDLTCGDGTCYVQMPGGTAPKMFKTGKWDTDFSKNVFQFLYLASHFPTPYLF